jgi:hypothetical protein
VLCLGGYALQVQAIRLRQQSLQQANKKMCGPRGKYRKWALAGDIEELLEDFKIQEFKANLRYRYFVLAVSILCIA